jgi:hypothetical protein
MFTVCSVQPKADSNINLDVQLYYSRNLPICSHLFLFVGYLITLSVARLYSVEWIDDR